MIKQLPKRNLRKELMRMFEGIEGEMDLIKASAKFNYAINKTPEKYTEIIVAYTEDTEKLVQILKKRIKLLWEVIAENHCFRGIKIEVGILI